MALKHTFDNIPWGVHHGILSLGNALLRFVKHVCTEKAKQESMSFQHQMWTTVINKPLVSGKLWEHVGVKMIKCNCSKKNKATTWSLCSG